MTRRILAWVVFALVAALYASAVVTAVGNIVLMPQLAAQLGLGINAVGWFWLVFGIALPIVGFVLAWLFGRGRSGGMRLLSFAAGLCLVAVIQIDVMHAIPQAGFFV